VRIRCERGTLELPRADFCRVLIEPDGPPLVDPLTGEARAATVGVVWTDEREMVGYQAFRNEFDDWRDAIVSARPPVLSGNSVLPTVRLIEESYARATTLPEPWGELPAAAAPAVVTGPRKRVLVTGAGGFLGCRTVELLRERYGWDVRAFVKRPSS